MANTSGGTRPLHLQTIDSLFAELIAGRGVSVGEDNAEFRLDNVDSRAILNWYRVNRAKWAGNVMTPDVEQIVSSILTAPTPPPIPEVITPKAGHRLKLSKVVAHRFAGVHSYGTDSTPPQDFEFGPRAPITLFEGWNGAGKTSLLNTIIWCLTGSILRPQRQPESGSEEFEGRFARTTDGVDEETSHTLTPVTPLPDPRNYVPPRGGPIPIDSWVELTFVDSQGKGHLLARRLFRPRQGDELALAAEAPDPRGSKPTLLFSAGSLVLHRVVGMLTEQPPPPFGGGEAVEISSAASLAHVKSAYRVREESGIPLVLPGQVVLGGDLVSKDQLSVMEGTLIALTLADGNSVFKRVGKSVPGTGGRLWQFESVGGLGSSVIASLTEEEDGIDAPRYLSARRILGVLYTV